MQDNAPQPSAEIDALAVAQAYQDNVIARRLPGWMVLLSESEHDVLGDALRNLLACRQRLTLEFAQVRGIDEFTKPLLQQALDRLGSFRIDQLYMRRWYTFTSNTVSYLAGRVPVQDSDYYDLPLLEAALYNFTEDERSVQPLRNAVVDIHGSGQAGLSALAFAGLCRDLDLGQQYQDHLDAILLRQTGQQSVKALQADFQRNSMLADALQAKAQGELSEAELQLVIGLCRDNRPGWLEGAPVQARQLKLFGCSLQRIVVLEVIDTGVIYNSIKRVLVYVPGDPQGAWSACDDLDDYVRRVLGMRLRDQGYRRFFSRFVRRRDAQQLFAAVSDRLDDVADWATRDLDEQTTGYPLPLFDQIGRAHV